MLNQTYQVLNEIIVSKQGLIQNYQYFTSKNSNTKIAPVIKANAYGHGLIPIAQFIDQNLPVPMLCVDSLYEAYELYKSKIKTPILIMGYTNPINYQVWKTLPFIFGISDIESLHFLSKYQPGARIHIKLDTGMCRLGIRESEVNNFIIELNKYTNLKIEGIFSHLSQADDPSRATFTNKQVRRFKSMVNEFEKAGYHFKWKHITATSGVETIHDSYFNLARVGLGFYGYSPFGPHTKEGSSQRQYLQPALTLISHIALTKQLFPGDMVSYGGTYKVKQNEQIAILPIGYHEGLSRILSNRGTVTIKEKECPIIGRVCMNMTMVKITRNIIAKPGDEVMIISPKISDPNSIYKITQIEDTIPYTVLTALHSSIKRRIV
jgi:alanine racemase